jgi:hypothetical protein
MLRTSGSWSRKPRICAFKPARQPITEGDGGGAPDNGRPFFHTPDPSPAGKIPPPSLRQACWLAYARRDEERMELPDRALLEDIQPRLAFRAAAERFGDHQGSPSYEAVLDSGHPP